MKDVGIPGMALDKPGPKAWCGAGSEAGAQVLCHSMRKKKQQMTCDGATPTIKMESKRDTAILGIGLAEKMVHWFGSKTLCREEGKTDSWTQKRI